MHGYGGALPNGSMQTLPHGVHLADPGYIATGHIDDFSAADSAGCAGASCGDVIGCSPASGGNQMAFVGVGGGDYIKETSYRFVGPGAGAFEVDTPIGRPSTESRVHLGGVCAAVTVLLVVLFFVVPVGPTSATSTLQTSMYTCTPSDAASQAAWSPALRMHCCQSVGVGCEGVASPTSAAPQAQVVSTLAKTSASRGECLIWGDPHYKTFDGARIDFFGEGQVWAVKTESFQVQVRYLATPFTNGLAATHDVAISGPAIQDHILKIGPLNGGRITWDGNAILSSFGKFNLQDLGEVSYTNEGNLVDDAQVDLPKKVVHVSLPDNFEMHIFRWENHLNIRIVMEPTDGQSGHCGNFNGDPSDDTKADIVRAIGDEVQKADLIFNSYTPRTHGLTPNLDDCMPEQRAKAESECKKQQDGLVQLDEQALASCIFDVCFAGGRYAVQDRIGDEFA